MVQAHIVYSGVVQGVGFRFTAQRLAKDRNLTGWVRNLSDGRVEILVEGLKEKVEDFVQSLGEHFGDYIESKDINFSVAQGAFSSFSIYSTH